MIVIGVAMAFIVAAAGLVVAYVAYPSVVASFHGHPSWATP